MDTSNVAGSQRGSSVENKGRSMRSGNGDTVHARSKSVPVAERKGGTSAAKCSSSTSRTSTATTSGLPSAATWSLGGDWNCPIRQDWDVAKAGIYLISDEAQLRACAAEAALPDVIIGAVCPQKILGITPTEPVMMTVPLLKENEGVTTQCLLPGYVYQLSKQAPKLVTKTITLQLRGDRMATVVLSALLEDNGLSADTAEALKSEKKGDSLQAVLPHVEKSVREAIQDVWRVHKDGPAFKMLMRVRQDKLAELLRTSGSHLLWYSTPREMMDKTKVVWLRTGFGANKHIMSLEEARAHLDKVPNHQGLIMKDGGFGVRVANEHLCTAL